VADGAFAIAATLATPEAVGAAQRGTVAAGVHVLTFNSGADASRSVGAYAHLGLDDRRGGDLAGE
jgi:ABC-type sugar transport system substrate-binding protein